MFLADTCILGLLTGLGDEAFFPKWGIGVIFWKGAGNENLRFGANRLFLDFSGAERRGSFA